MDKDKTSAVDEFLGDLKNNDNDGVFEEDKGENLFGDVTIKEEDKGEKVEDDNKPLPFHKDPKVQKYIEKELEKKLKDIKPQVIEREVVKEAVPVDLDIWERIIGNDTPEKQSALRDLRNALEERDERTVRRTLEELEQKRQAEIAEEKAAELELEQGFSDIETNFNVDLTSKAPTARKLRNEFLEFVERVAPKDEDGNIKEYPDFEQTFMLFQELRKPEPNTRARELASRSMTRSGDASQVQLPKDQSFSAVEKIFSKMFNN